jgi:hypothetical protein
MADWTPSVDPGDWIEHAPVAAAPNTDPGDWIDHAPVEQPGILSKAWSYVPESLRHGIEERGKRLGQEASEFYANPSASDAGGIASMLDPIPGLTAGQANLGTAADAARTMYYSRFGTRDLPAGVEPERYQRAEQEAQAQAVARYPETAQTLGATMEAGLAHPYGIAYGRETGIKGPKLSTPAENAAFIDRMRGVNDWVDHAPLGLEGPKGPAPAPESKPAAPTAPSAPPYFVDLYDWNNPKPVQHDVFGTGPRRDLYPDGVVPSPEAPKPAPTEQPATELRSADLQPKPEAATNVEQPANAPDESLWSARLAEPPRERLPADIGLPPETPTEARTAPEAPPAPAVAPNVEPAAPVSRAPAAPPSAGFKTHKANGEPLSLLGFLKANGGIKPSTELTNLGITPQKFPGLISNKGKPHDTALGSMIEHGYMGYTDPNAESPHALPDFYDTLARDLIAKQRVTPYGNDQTHVTKQVNDQQFAEQQRLHAEAGRKLGEIDAEHGTTFAQDFDAFPEAFKDEAATRISRGENPDDVIHDLIVREVSDTLSPEQHIQTIAHHDYFPGWEANETPSGTLSPSRSDVAAPGGTLDRAARESADLSNRERGGEHGEVAPVASGEGAGRAPAGNAAATVNPNPNARPIPELNDGMSGSWVVVSKETGKPALETFERKTAEAINQDKYEVLTAHQWLSRYNRLVKENGGGEPSPEAFRAASQSAKPEPQFEAGAEGKPQQLIPGVAPVTDRERLQAQANKPLRGGNAELQHEGLFGDAQNQKELFGATAARPGPAEAAHENGLRGRYPTLEQVPHKEKGTRPDLYDQVYKAMEASQPLAFEYQGAPREFSPHRIGLVNDVEGSRARVHGVQTGGSTSKGPVKSFAPRHFDIDQIENLKPSDTEWGTLPNMSGAQTAIREIHAEHPDAQPNEGKMFALRGFHSPFERAVETFPQDKAAPQQWLAALNKLPGAKDYLAHTGTEDWLAGKKSVTKTELLNHLRGNAPDLEERTLSRDAAEDARAEADAATDKFERLAAKYRTESFYQLPDEARSVKRDDVIEAQQAKKAADERLAQIKDDETQYPGTRLAGGTNYQETLIRANDLEGKYSEPHWNQEEGSKAQHGPVVAHVTHSDIPMPDGGTGLLLNHIQSRFSADAARPGENVPSYAYQKDRTWQMAAKVALRKAVEGGYDALVLPDAEQVEAANSAKSGSLKVFYDQKLPRWLGDYAKQWGGKLEKEWLPDSDSENGHLILRITPEMHEALSEGGPGQAYALKGDSEARTHAMSQLAAGRAVEAPHEIITAAHEAMKPYVAAIPEGTKLGALASLESSGPGEYKATFKHPDGSTFMLPVDSNAISHARAFYDPDTRSLVSFRLGSFAPSGDVGVKSGNVQSDVAARLTGGAIAHEVVHANWRNIPAPIRQALVRHSDSLGIMDRQAKDYLKEIGDPSWKEALPGTWREAYEDAYSDRSPRAMKSAMDEEAASHMMELYKHGALTDEQIAPVKDALEGILRGDYSKAAKEATKPTLQTDTPAFRKWFGKSKIVDKNGKPLVVYHGTTSPDIEAFLPEGGGKRGDPQNTLERFRKAKENNEPFGLMQFRDGSFFSPHPEYAGHYTAENTGLMYPAYIKAENPAYYNQSKSATEEWPRWKGTDPNRTPDALIFHENGKINEIAVIDPTQIKSAIGNRGTFDPNDPRITYARRAAPHPAKPLPAPPAPPERPNDKLAHALTGRREKLRLGDLARALAR